MEEIVKGRNWTWVRHTLGRQQSAIYMDQNRQRNRSRGWLKITKLRTLAEESFAEGVKEGESFDREQSQMR